MFYEFLKFFAYQVCDLLPLGSETHVKLVSYYFNYEAISGHQKIVCLILLALSIFTYFISDFYKMIKESFRATWLLFIGRGTVREVCTDFKYLNMLLSVLTVSASAYFSFMLGDHLGSSYYLIGGMLLVSAFALRVSETFAFVKTDGKLLGYREVFGFVVLQLLSSFSGASRMALMMGGGKFMGIEKKHLIRFIFLSLAPVIIIRIVMLYPDMNAVYETVIGNIWTFIILFFCCLVFLAISMRIFVSEGFYKFYYYLAGLGIWTILDFFFSKRGL